MTIFMQLFNKFKYFILGALLMVAGTAFAVQVSVPSGSSAGLLLQSLTSGNWNPVQLIAGSNITISSTTAAITISSTGGGSGGTGTVSTSSIPTVGQLAYWTSNGFPSLLGSVATGTVSAGSSAITVTAGRSVVGGALAIDCATAGAGQNGCLSSTDWSTFNNKGSGTVTNIATGLGLSGGAITTTGTISLASSSIFTGTQGQVAYFNGTNSLVGTSSLFIDTGGRIGIGTVTPTAVNANAKITVAGTGSQDYVASTTDDTTLSDAIYNAYAVGSRVFLGAHGASQVTSQYGITVGGYAELGALNSSSGSSNGLLIGTRTTATPIVFGTNSTERLRIQSDGKTGLGTSSPFAMFSIHHNAIANYTTIFAIASSTQTSTTTLFSVNNVGLASTTALRISNTGSAATQCLHADVTGLISGTGSDCGSGGGGLSSYDAFTHPLGNQSATTSQMIFNNMVGIGSSTLFSGLSILATSTTGSGFAANTGISSLLAIASSTGGTSTSTLFSFQNNGNVDFGTTSTKGFHLISNAGTTGNGLQITTGAANTGVFIDPVGANATENLVLSSVGNNNSVVLRTAVTNVAVFNFGNGSTFTSLGWTFTPSAVGSGVFSHYTLNSAADASLTVGAEVPTFIFGSNSIRSHAQGLLPLQRETLFKQPTYSFAAFGGNIVDDATVGIVAPPLTGTNATTTNAYGLLIGSSTPSIMFNASTTNTYGLGVFAAGGAVRNFAAFFKGLVGFGTTTPNSTVEINGGFHVEEVATSSVTIDFCDSGTNNILSTTTGAGNTTITFTNANKCPGKGIVLHINAPASGVVGSTTFSGGSGSGPIIWDGNINPGNSVLNSSQDRFLFTSTSTSSPFITADLTGTF